MESLAASLSIVRPWLYEDLVATDAVPGLLRTAATLPPVHCAGFEVRLGRGDTTVDLVQRIRGLRGEPQVLLNHIESGGLANEPVWRRLRDFCRAWSHPASRLDRMVAGCLVGFDSDTAAAPIQAPFLYLLLEPGSTAAIDPFMELLEEASSLLTGASLPAALAARVRRCHRDCPHGAAITDIGFMLSRNIEAVRLVITPVSKAAIAEFLAVQDWPEGSPSTDEALALLPEAAEQLGLSLDVAERLVPRVGVEYYPGPLDADLPAWQDALDALVASGLCSEPKRDALLRWPGHVEPTDTTEDWPASLLVASLLNRPDRFMVLARRLTFLKLVCQPDQAPTAKAYFGFGPRSFAASHQNDGQARETVAAKIRADRDPAAIEAGGATSAAGACRVAIEAAAEFLIANRESTSHWLEFPRVLEGTDEWATGYVGLVLASVPGGGHLDAGRAAWNWLGKQRGDGNGWGYNAGLPQDADSTLWALRLADALGEDGTTRARQARGVLEQHVLDSGGVATYEPGAEAGLRSALGSADLTGMYVAHTCVSAAVASFAGLGERVMPFLIDRQEVDGRWRGFWWSDAEYATALTVQALARRDDPCCAAPLLKARQWAAGRVDRSGAVWSRALGASSAFCTALCIEIMLRTDRLQGASSSSTDAVGMALRWLLEAQSHDGSWPASALMRMPPTDAVDGDEQPAATTVSVDDRRVFTTATVVRALSLIVERDP